MRLVAIDYVIATLVGLAATGTIYKAGSEITSTLKGQRAPDQLSASFSLGDQSYRIDSAQAGCVGDIVVRARQDSVTAVFVNGTLRLTRDDVVLPATVTSSFAFNPLRQLYEGNIAIALGSNRVGDIAIRHVKPYEITLSGFSLPKETPFSFSIPGPIMISPGQAAKTFVVRPPTEIDVPVPTARLKDFFSQLGLSLTSVPFAPNAQTPACSTQGALNLKEVEAVLTSLLPTGMTP